MYFTDYELRPAPANAHQDARERAYLAAVRARSMSRLDDDDIAFMARALVAAEAKRLTPESLRSSLAAAGCDEDGIERLVSLVF